MSEIRFNSGGNWNTMANAIHAWDGSDWDTTINKVHGWNGTEWQELWPLATPPDPPSPGEHIISPSTLYIGHNTGYAEFETSAFQGYITEVKVQITWLDGGGYTTGFDIAGRPTMNNYRYIENNAGEWDGRTISHGVSSFDSAALTEFNSGAATGYSFDSGTFILDRMISYARLILIV